MSKRKIIVAVSVAALLSGSAALAQDRDRPGSWWPHWGMGPMMSQDGFFGWPMGMGRWRGSDRVDRLEGRLAYIKAELDIDEDQATTWETFAEAVRASSAAHNEMMRTMWEGEGGEKSSDVLDQHITFMEARLIQLKALKDASEKLYAVLSDEQRATADEILLPVLEPGPFGGRWMMRG